jgi:transposase InsO family protein
MIRELVEHAVKDGARRARACAELGLRVRTLQRWQREQWREDLRAGPRRAPGNRLDAQERSQIAALVTSPEYRDLSPKQIVPRLADRGMYLGSESTMYRLLRERGQLKHRSAARPAQRRAKPRLKATGPNQVWCWDITYLKSPVLGRFYYLYLVVDLFSRKIVAAEVHDCECSAHAAALIDAACARERVRRDTLTLHADNGTIMKGATLLGRLQVLGVLASYSRPSVSDDNAYAEALFRTLKYRPDYPDGVFASLDSARRWVACFVHWYNTEHRHSAIRFVTPDERHRGCERRLLAQRQAVYEIARARNPERWTGATRCWTPIDVVHLNSPETQATSEVA